MIRIVAYTSDLKADWNNFNDQAVNGLFLFYREYMEYHANRFQDFSLLFYFKNKLVGILPLNREQQVATSHAGLTFGGIIYHESMRTNRLLEIFGQLLAYLESRDISKLIYKPVPAIFQQKINQADLFALHYFDARLLTRALSSALDLRAPLLYSKLRKRCLQKALQSKLEVRQTTDYVTFMAIVQKILEQKYAITPTHSAAEITYLARLFPQQIKLWAAFYGAEMIGGVLVYEHAALVHLQYIALSDKGKKLNALDLLIYTICHHYRSEKDYLNFGVSTEPGTNTLNQNLLQNKESYGATAVVQDIYEICLK